MTDSLLLSPIPDDHAIYAGKTFSERLTGRFYTPDVVGHGLAGKLCDFLRQRWVGRRNLRRAFKVCDPFCGDGRLIIAFLIQASKHTELASVTWAITIRDIDAKAVKSAAAGIAETATQLGLRVSLQSAVGNTFTAKLEEHDIVITNPPWEQLKPDRRELGHMSARENEAHRLYLRELSDVLDSRFPEARGSKSWAGWGTNLARCGWAAALRSCVKGGALGIVLPASILADQASEAIRKFAFSSSRLLELSTYPAEARLFPRVDQPVIAAMFHVGSETETMDASFELFDGKCHRVNRYRFRSSLSELASQGYSIPIGYAPGTSAILRQLKNLPSLSEMEGDAAASLWSGRELDETRISEKIVGGKKYPFLKGRMVRRHGIAEAPKQSVRHDLVHRLKSITYERIAWRDVSRASQARRMIGSIIPAGWVTGNSLHVAHFRDGDPIKLRALYAVLSSFVFEFQMRSRLATGHMSLGIVRATRIPELHGRVLRDLAAATEATLVGGQDTFLEIAVAKAYGLSRDSMEQVISQFPKIAPEQREALLAREVWRHSSAK